MKLILTLSLLFFFTHDAFSFTLASSSRRGFPNHELTIDTTSNSCANTGLTSAELLDLAFEAADMYWNRVSTSKLELKKGVQRNISISGDTTALQIANRAQDNHILVGCNANLPGLDNEFIGAVGGFTCYAAGNCRGYVVLNNHPNSNLSTFSRAELLALMGHELGHAVGLGHSSVEEALMYYSLSGKTQEFLHQDDIRGISYLYPQDKKIGGLAGACGTIALINNQRPPGPPTHGVPITLALGLLLLYLSLKMISKRPIAQPSA
jgi:hypothetical protein